MRIAWYTHRYHPCIGGAETYGRAMIKRFVEAGHHVDVLTSDAKDLWYFSDPSRARLDAPQTECVEGAHVHRFSIHHFPFQKYVGKLLQLVPHWPTQCRRASYMPWIPDLERHRGDYDAVFAVGFPFTLFSHAAYREARRNGAPLILTPFLHLATPGDKVNRHYTRPHQVRLLKEADLVVVVTNLEREAVARWGIDRGKILLNPMGFDHREVTGGNGHAFREKLGIPTDRLVVGHLATLDPNKGTNDLVLAISRINDQRPHANPVSLVLAGVSSPHFESFAAQLPESSKRWLIRTGPLVPEDKAAFFNLIDLFAMPSRTDSFGIVFLEAWANGKPVVAARAGGVSEVVEHERTGFLVEFGDVVGLASSISRLLDNPSLRHRLGHAGRSKVERGHSWDDCHARLDERLRSLISPKETDRRRGELGRPPRFSRLRSRDTTPIQS